MVVAKPLDPQTEERAAGSLTLGSIADPSQDLIQLFGNTHTTSGMNVTENTALTIPAVWQAVRRISEDMGKLPMVTYKKLARGKQQVPAHPMHRIIANRPNANMGPFDFRQAMTAYALLFGNCYAEIERARDGTPIALWPLEPWRVWPRYDWTRGGLLYYDVPDAGPNRRIEATDMFHIKGFGFGVVGFMLCRMAKECMAISMAAETFAASFFGNSAQPSGVLEAPQMLGPEEKKELKEQWNGQHRGSRRANGLAILPKGLTWKQISINPDQAQFLETRQFQVVEIARFFGLPPHKVMDLTKGTFANVEHLAIEYVSDCIMTWCCRWEDEIAAKLRTGNDHEVWPHFSTAGLLRADTKTRYDAYAQAIQAGWLSRNDVREMENLDPVDGLDTYLVNSTMISASAVETVTKSQMLLKLKGIDTPALAQDAADASTSDDSQVDDVAQGIDEVQPTAPPAGIIVQGSQPTDMTYYGTRSGDKRELLIDAIKTTTKGIADSHSRLLADAVRRLLHIEADKVTRATKKENFSGWAEGFYRNHAASVTKAVEPVLTAAAQATWQARSIRPNPHHLAAGIQRIVAKHIEESRSDLKDAEGLPERVAHWEELRPEQFAKDQLVEFIEGLSHG